MKDRVIVALDVEYEKAVQLVEEIGDLCSFYKVGLSLFYESFEKIISFLKKREKRIFLDLKLHDIPYQVERAVKSLNRFAADFLTVHASAGPETISAARNAALPQTKIIAVTVLTSIENDNIQNRVMELAKEAVSAGADGIVCSGLEVALFKKSHPDSLAIVPGVRLNKANTGDQKRVVTPEEAFQNGADYIVVGREITQSNKPAEIFEAIIKKST